MKRQILLNPGPATTTQTVKEALVCEDICPREKSFGHLIQDIREQLVRVIHGEKTHKAILFTSSGTGAVEAVMSSVIAPDKKVLICNNGAYGDRLEEICERLNVQYISYKCEWGQSFSLKDIRDLCLRSQREQDVLSHIAFIHHETTTGMLNPLPELTQLAHEFKLEVIVDAMSSFAGIPIHVDQKESAAEYIISSSNKCIQGMAGIGIVLAKESSLLKTSDFPRRSYYFNLYENYLFQERTQQFQFTPPVQILNSLHQAIKEYFEEGEEKRWQRYSALYSTLTAGLKKLGFKFLVADESQHSRILTAVLEPTKLTHPQIFSQAAHTSHTSQTQEKSFDFESMHDFFFSHGITLYPGKSKQSKQPPCFRIANMGDLHQEDIELFLQLMHEYLNLRN